MGRLLANLMVKFEALSREQPHHDFSQSIEKRVEKFEELRSEWSVNDVVGWIKLIENGHFDDDQFADFFDKLQKMEVTGKKLKEMNSKIALEMMGFDEENQRILLRNIVRVSKQQDETSRDICGLCTVNKINSVIIPCGHQHACYDCMTRHQLTKCPICRKRITKTIKTFMNGF